MRLVLAVLNVFGWPLKYLWSLFVGDGELEKLPLRTLKVQVIIVDYDENTKNPCTEQELDDRLRDADRILRERSRIAVERSGPIRRMRSRALYRIDASGRGALFGEYLRGLYLLTGRGSWRHLTVYAAGSISGAEGVHLPLHGSVFIRAGANETVLCHEIGHALLGVFNARDITDPRKKDHLMYFDTATERSCGWPSGVPKLSRNARSDMRRSRWLGWSWLPVVP